MATTNLIWLLPLPPLLAFFIIVLFTNKSNKLSHSIGVGAAALSWAGAMVVFFRALGVEHFGEHPFTDSIKWLPLGDGWLEIGVRIDPLSAAVLFFVGITIFMIFLYSVGYHNFGQPKGDHDKQGFLRTARLLKMSTDTNTLFPPLSRCMPASSPLSVSSPLGCTPSLSPITY